MSISKRDAKLLLYLLAIVIFVVAYAVIYLPYGNQADACDAKTEELRPTLTQMQDYYAHLDEYKAGITKYRETETEELAKYPTDVRYEDLIEFSTGLQSKLGISLSSLDFSIPAQVQNFSISESDANGKITSTANRLAYQTGAILSCDMTYAQMKKLIDAIGSADGRTSLNSLDVSYNSTTGQLTAKVDVEKYFITSDFSYNPTVTPQTELGKSDLFGTASAPSSASSASSAASSAASSTSP